jgi:hypothetical protein
MSADSNIDIESLDGVNIRPTNIKQNISYREELCASFVCLGIIVGGFIVMIIMM